MMKVYAPQNNYNYNNNYIYNIKYNTHDLQTLSNTSDYNDKINNNKENNFVIYIILAVISYSFLLGILIYVYFERNSENDKFELIYYLSKILTVKSIIVDNHCSELLGSFSPSGKPEALSYTYRNLLKLVKNNNECVENYRPCGILDTYGNVLCIEEFIPCPINKIRIAHINISEEYLSENYRTTPLTNISNNYQCFYSNEFNEGNGVTIILKTKEEPKFISMNNFILDSETYEEIFGDEEYLKKIADILGIEEEEKSENENVVVETVTKIFQEVKDLSEELSEMSLQLKGAKLLIKILLYAYNERMERFQKFIKEKVEFLDKNNNDFYLEHIGDNFYTKNYIGFKSIEDIDKFLEFDFRIYKNIFPNHIGAIIALVGAIIIALLLIIGGILAWKNEGDLPCVFVVISLILYYLIAVGFLAYDILVFINVNNNKKFDDLKSVETDKLIKNMINDFIKECQKWVLVLCTLIIIFISVILNVISLIFYKKQK